MSKLLEETDRVIVTEWRRAVGAETGSHRHAHDCVVCPRARFWLKRSVAQESKGLAVGSTLHRALERIVRRERVEAVCCEVNIVPPNPESLAFHTALGFRRIQSLVTLDGREVELLKKEFD